MKNLKNKKAMAVLGLSALCVVLVFGIYFIAQSPKTQDDIKNPDDVVSDIIPSDMPDAAPIAAIDNIKPSDIPTPTATPKPTETTKENDIALTVIEEKPQPPEKPDTAIDTGEPHEIPTDPALINPDKKPASTPVIPKPVDNSPKNGDKNSKGEVYFEGFGWIKDEGGGVEVKESGSDGDWNKIIGN